MSDPKSDDIPVDAKFQIFRAADAPGLMASGCMTLDPFTPVQRTGMDKVLASGYLEGDEVRVLVNIPGFSLAYVWFKKDYPLPLHSHDSDCLYYIIAGSLRMGTEELGAKDSFFLPGGTPYTYKPGPDGVELLEFRTSNTFNFANLAKGEAFWNRAAQTVAANLDDWKAAVPPSVKAQPEHA